MTLVDDATPGSPEPAPQSHVKRSSMRKKHALQLFKTDLCKFFEQGMCKHGNWCAFAHNVQEVRSKPDLTRTSMCGAVLQGGVCRDPRCSFAHDKDSLRTTCGFFKTRMCNYARSGKCRSGDTCRFAHVPEELRSLEPLAPGKDDARAQAGPTWPASQVARKLASPWRNDGSAGSSAGSSDGRNSSATEVPQSDSTARRPLSSGSSSGHDGAPRAPPASPGGLAVPAAAAGQRKSARGGGRRESGRSAEAQVTSLLVSNVPKHLTQEALLSALEDRYSDMRGTVDFFYCPWDETASCNQGYAFLNFTDAQHAGAFQRHWANKEIFPQLRGHAAGKRLQIERAAVQGLAASTDFFSDASTLSQVLHLRPLVRDAGGAMKPLQEDMFKQGLQGGSWFFGQPGWRGSGPTGAAACAPGPEEVGGCSAAPGRGQGAGGCGATPGAGFCGMWPPQEGTEGTYRVAESAYGIAGAPLQPMWPVQMPGQQGDLGPAKPVGEALEGEAKAGGAPDCGQMIPGMECTYMLMPVEYVNPTYFPVVIAEPAGGTPCMNDMAMGANWAPPEAEVAPAVPFPAPQWPRAGVARWAVAPEDEIYSD